ncbi:type II toxin-antitoxin system RelE/ParE family toxin [Avibacterium sp. 20-126]|uniref:type II toxin-antitoxin system RelE/ParE family toxin n=1 Tax=Avibacterium sp. 20-126 TaxID=2911524 RepID=UPI0021864642|nr:type II toxin-antitoxin system RelE/ParE family toxin [Avibacterium sp. 20-126]
MEKINEIRTTAEFDHWLMNLKNRIAKMAIIKRIERAEQGNFGDHKPLGGGLYEMRIATGAGYRVYYIQDGNTLYFLLCGGDKSTQQAGINKARMMIED